MELGEDQQDALARISREVNPNKKSIAIALLIPKENLGKLKEICFKKGIITPTSIEMRSENWMQWTSITKDNPFWLKKTPYCRL